MRCPVCGARNPDGAPWCGQCLTPLEEEEAPPPEPTAARAAAERLASSPHFRRVEGRLEWRCRACASWNDLDDARCVACETPFGEALLVQPVQSRRDVGLPVAVVSTVLLPGAGHLLAGRVATGSARALTYLVWLVGGIALLRAGGRVGRSVLPAVPLLGGALVLWALSLHDVTSLLHDDGRELLTARVLLWTVVGVLLALLATFLLPG